MEGYVPNPERSEEEAREVIQEAANDARVDAPERSDESMEDLQSRLKNLQEERTELTAPFKEHMSILQKEGAITDEDREKMKHTLSMAGELRKKLEPITEEIEKIKSAIAHKLKGESR